MSIENGFPPCIVHIISTFRPLNLYLKLTDKYVTLMICQLKFSTTSSMYTWRASHLIFERFLYFLTKNKEKYFFFYLSSLLVQSHFLFRIWNTHRKWEKFMEANGFEWQICLFYICLQTPINLILSYRPLLHTLFQLTNFQNQPYCNE